MRYVFNSDHLGDVQREVVDRLQDRNDVRFQDVADADEGQKGQLYRNILSPLSIINGKDLDVFQTDDGSITFAEGVLITPDTYYVGDEVLDHLDEEE